MKPGTRELLGAILDIANAALSDMRRRVDSDDVARLRDQAAAIAAAPDPDGRPLVNEWTLLQLHMLGKLAALGPWGDASEIVRTRRIVGELCRFIREDLATAMDREARPSTSDAAENRRAKWPS